jgi:hypothetical protein
MRTDISPAFRVAGLAATATTLVALVAMSATVSIGPTLRACEVEARLEDHVVRAVAAAVAAAARDLLVLERPEAAVVVGGPWVQTGRDAVSRLEMSHDVPRGEATRLGERLLDLPPPA